MHVKMLMVTGEFVMMKEDVEERKAVVVSRVQALAATCITNLSTYFPSLTSRLIVEAMMH
jgi:hypothetical protein